MSTLKRGDHVRVTGTENVGRIDRIVEDMAIVKEPFGKYKIKVDCLEKIEEEATVTAKDYDEAVRGILEGIQREAEESDDNAVALMSLVVSITEDLKQRLFGGGD